MKYRPEIDGLRAVAVVPVIFFHAGVSFVSGGFVGVDVFFVISGFLITSLILGELSLGTFSLLNFYERRARRILPALFVVLAVCIPVAWMILLPTDMRDFSKSLVAICLFGSNVLFSRERSYFAPEADFQPLLHTWSLGVEEQYYMLFPILMFVIWRFGRRKVLLVLLVLTFTSLAIAESQLTKSPTDAFFLLPSRAWELLVGAIVALTRFTDEKQSPKAYNRVTSEMLAASGLLLILFAILEFDSNARFPGVQASIPVIGTALILWFAGPQTITGRILQHRSLVFIGLISYSAYLWHEPIFAFARHRASGEPPAEVLVVLVAVTFLLAYLSWRFVEAPFRNRRKFSRSQVLGFALAGSLVVVCIGVTGYVTNGLFYTRGVMAAEQETMWQRLRPTYGLHPRCGERTERPVECQTSPEPELLLWGDSYAMHLAPGLLASNPTAKMVQMTASVCGPILDIAPISAQRTKSWGSRCIEENRAVMNFVHSQKTLKYAVLSSPLDQYVANGAQVMTTDGTLHRGEEVVLAHFRRTLDELVAAGVTPLIVAPTPRTGRNFGRCLTRAVLKRLTLVECDFDLADATAKQAQEYRLLQALDVDYRVLWLSDGMCTNGRCRASLGDVMVYRDRGHLSVEGSIELGARMNFWKAVTAP